jgi:hypothetical protein
LDVVVRERLTSTFPRYAMQRMKTGFSLIARSILYVAWFVLTGLVLMWGLVVLLLYMGSSGALIIDTKWTSQEADADNEGSASSQSSRNPLLKEVGSD